MAELKPCPWCLEKEDYVIFVKNGWFAIECGSCYAHGPVSDTKQAAIDAWNKRS